MKLNFKKLFFINIINFAILFCRIDDLDLTNWKKSYIDVTVVGYILNADGLGRLSIGFIENFYKKLNINFIATRPSVLKDVEDNVIKIINKKSNIIGNVSVLFDALEYPYNNYFEKVPNSLIKIAYSMFESSEIPQEWAKILNEQFDLVVVPCSYLVNVYKNSGVNIPIFNLPIGIYIDDFLNSPEKDKRNDIFTFGCSASITNRKNVANLIKAFLNIFRNNSNCKLKIHYRGYEQEYFKEVMQLINNNKINNIELIGKNFSKEEYLRFMQSLDCYVLVSKSEGFSVSPRESIALGMPTIISNNTAHEVLCQTSYFISVKSNIIVPANYGWIFGKNIGYQFDCNIEDLANVLLDVYQNYEYYLEKSKKGREWVKQYTYQNLEKKYLNLFKPQNIIKGDDNVITDDYIMTSSEKLYQKYKIIKDI